MSREDLDVPSASFRVSIGFHICSKALTMAFIYGGEMISCEVCVVDDVGDLACNGECHINVVQTMKKTVIIVSITGKGWICSSYVSASRRQETDDFSREKRPMTFHMGSVILCGRSEKRPMTFHMGMCKCCAFCCVALAKAWV